MIKEVTVPARYCVCDVCGYDWHSIAGRIPESCQNRACRSRLWNGKKERKRQEKKPSFVLPRPNKVRGGNEDEF